MAGRPRPSCGGPSNVLSVPAGRTRPDPADAIVVGSGAAGGWAAKTLSEAGLSVLVLEAGPEVFPEDVKSSGPLRMAKRFARVASGRQRMQGFHPAYWSSDPDLWIDDASEPITTPAGYPYNWFRSSLVGGRTLTWGGVCLRLSDYEMESASREGFGFDWPIRSRHLAAAFERIEEALGVHGTRDGLPQLPDGRYLEPHPLTASEMKLREAVERTWPERRLIPCRGIDGTEAPQAGRAWNRLSSCGSSLADALATGRTTLLPCSLVTHLVVDGSGRRARGVRYIDKRTGGWEEAEARIIVLCASALSSVLILLRTAADRPGGPLDEAGTLGRYIMDHVYTGSMVSIAGVPYHAPYPRTGADSFLIPRYQNLATRTDAFRGGFGVWGAIQREGFSGRRWSNSAIGFMVAHGDMEPRPENRIELGPGRDAWGLPVPHIDCRLSENDTAMREAMRASIAEMLDKAGGRMRSLFGFLDFPGPWRMVARLEKGWHEPPPGSSTHEVGGARMGEDPGTSVVDPRNRCWGLPNVLVTDGACWPTAGWQNSTLTVMAVTVRACELAVQSLNAREL